MVGPNWPSGFPFQEWAVIDHIAGAGAELLSPKVRPN